MKIKILFFLFVVSSLAMTQIKKMSAPSDVKQIEGIVYHIVQGVRLHRTELILNNLANEDYRISQGGMKTIKIKENFNNFFSVSKDRKMNKIWIKSSPNPLLSANWDFNITKPIIKVNDNNASANFDFYWLVDAPINGNKSSPGLSHPTKIHNDKWNFKKVKGQWFIVKLGLFINIINEITN